MLYQSRPSNMIIRRRKPTETGRPTDRLSKPRSHRAQRLYSVRRRTEIQIGTPRSTPPPPQHSRPPSVPSRPARVGPSHCARCQAAERAAWALHRNPEDTTSSKSCIHIQHARYKQYMQVRAGHHSVTNGGRKSPRQGETARWKPWVTPAHK